MKKYVLAYKSGCKGDFLCNFLNYEKFFIDNFNTNKSNGTIKKLEWCSKEELEEIYSKNILIWPAHNISQCMNDIHRFSLIPCNLAIEKKFYRTVEIENIIKNCTNIVNIVNLKNVWVSNFNSFRKDEIIDIKKIVQKRKSIQFYIDIFLTNSGITDFSNKNRFDEIIKLFHMIEEYENSIDDYRHVRGYDKTIFKKQISYGDIYVNKKYDVLYEIKPNFNPISYESLLEKTWLPDVVNVFGYDINLRKYGYRDY